MHAVCDVYIKRHIRGFVSSWWSWWYNLLVYYILTTCNPFRHFLLTCCLLKRSYILKKTLVGNNKALHKIIYLGFQLHSTESVVLPQLISSHLSRRSFTNLINRTYTWRVFIKVNGRMSNCILQKNKECCYLIKSWYQIKYATDRGSWTTEGYWTWPSIMTSKHGICWLNYDNHPGHGD